MTGLETTLAILSGIKKILQEISENMSEELTTQDKHNISEWGEWVRSCRSLVSYEFNQFEKLQTELTQLKAEKSGEWVLEEAYDHEYYTCSNCRESFILTDGTISDNNYNYCPNCGAKMKKEENQ